MKTTAVAWHDCGPSIYIDGGRRPTTAANYRSRTCRLRPRWPANAPAGSGAPPPAPPGSGGGRRRTCLEVGCSVTKRRRHLADVCGSRPAPNARSRLTQTPTRHPAPACLPLLPLTATRIHVYTLALSLSLSLSLFRAYTQPCSKERTRIRRWLQP